MGEHRLDKEKVLVMLTEISLQLEQLEKTIESSFSTIRKDLYTKELTRLDSVETKLAFVDKETFRPLSSSHEQGGSALELELGF
ncbi:MAG: hypothetical protein Q8898_11995 [Bacillota bacterium]|nr:hypothetical protein [Bacillota bacterium]